MIRSSVSLFALTAPLVVYGALWLALGQVRGATAQVSGEDRAPDTPHPTPDTSSWPGADLFASGAIPRIRIELEPDAVASLRNNAREFASATVSEGTTVYSQVGVHLKGSVGSFRGLTNKPSLTLDFSRFQDGRKFHGLRRIHLNNSLEDPSYANEIIGSELFRAAGVPAPRVSRALVVLNGRALGLYVLKEGFTEDFLSGHFRRVGGELYEPEGGHDVDQHLKRNSVLAPAGNRVALKALAAAAQEPDAAKRWLRLEAVLDTDRFLKFMAMEIMLGHRDGYCLARNNFRVYHDLDTDRMMFFPQGMDQLLGSADLPWQPTLAGLVAKAVMTTPEGSQRYAATFNSLFTNLFKVESLTNRVDQLVQELRPVLGGSEWSRLRDAAALVKDRIGQRQLNVVLLLGRAPLKPLEFEADVARLEGWLVEEAPMKGKMDQVKVHGPKSAVPGPGLRAQDSGPGTMAALHISAEAETVASWRTRALVERGRYRFEGRVRVAGVQALPYGVHQGAGLRVGGSVRQMDSVTGDLSWRVLAAKFEVKQASAEVEFICELRARAGEAWFDLNSLRVVRIDDL